MTNVYQRMARVQQRFSGMVSVYAEHLATGEIVQFGPHHPMETASTIKLPILAEALRQVALGRFDLAAHVPLLASDRVAGSGILQHLTPDVALPLQDILTLMIIVSDNIATNIILRLVGISQVNTSCIRWGMTDTVLKKRIDFSLPGPIGLSTPKDLATLLKGLYLGTVLPPAESSLAWDILMHQQCQQLLARRLPYDLIASEDDDIPPPIVIGSKSGSLRGVRNDAGIVRTPWGDYVLALMSESCHDTRFHVDNEAQQLLPEISRAVFDHFCPDALANLG
ncbi:MAG: class A beta-lactamase-related serine hydrolase [Thermaerobacter sp.]|nr:class A beta-lactamase-related serine hydrolase [Thermaerobacter sp.]